MFIVSTLSFDTSLRSLWKLLYSFVNRSLRQAILDHMQRFLEFDGCLRLWMALIVITSNVAPCSHSITRWFRSGEFGVYWSLVREAEHLIRSRSKFVLRTLKR